MKSFLDADLLPRVISGTSAGGLVAALVCTRTDEELRRLLVPELANRISACEEPFKVWFKRFWTTGARFDSVAWARKVSWSVLSNLTPFSLCIPVVHVLHSRIYHFPRSIHQNRQDTERIRHPGRSSFVSIFTFARVSYRGSNCFIDIGPLSC